MAMIKANGKVIVNSDGKIVKNAQGPIDGYYSISYHLTNMNSGMSPIHIKGVDGSATIILSCSSSGLQAPDDISGITVLNATASNYSKNSSPPYGGCSFTISNASGQVYIFVEAH